MAAYLLLNLFGLPLAMKYPSNAFQVGHMGSPDTACPFSEVQDDCLDRSHGKCGRNVMYGL